MLILLLKEYSSGAFVLPQSRGISAHQLILISTICSEIPKDAARLPTNSFFRLEAVKFPRGFAHLANIQKHCFNFPCLPLQHSLILILYASKFCNCIFLTKATFLLDMSTIHIHSTKLTWSELGIEDSQRHLLAFLNTEVTWKQLIFL